MNHIINPIDDFIAEDTKHISPTTITVLDHARDFVNSLNPEQRRRFRKMMEQGINVGESLAKTYDLDPTEFMQALKQVL